MFYAKNTNLLVVASTFLVAGIPLAQAESGQENPVKDSVPTRPGFQDENQLNKALDLDPLPITAPSNTSLLLTIGTQAAIAQAGIRPRGLLSHEIQVGVKWKTPWKNWDRVALGVGASFNPVIRNFEQASVFNYTVHVSGHIRRSLNAKWSFWLSAGPIVDCLECRPLVDFGFVASAALEYNSSVAATIGTQVIGYDLGRPGRPLGTEAKTFGGLRVRGKAAYIGFLPWVFILGIGVSAALPDHS